MFMFFILSVYVHYVIGKVKIDHLLCILCFTALFYSKPILQIIIIGSSSSRKRKKEKVVSIFAVAFDDDDDCRSGNCCYCTHTHQKSTAKRQTSLTIKEENCFAKNDTSLILNANAYV